MQAISDYKDNRGKTIADSEFNPFIGLKYVHDISEMTENTILIIDRPHYSISYVDCHGERVKVMRRVEGNIQAAIDNKVKNIFIINGIQYPANTYEDDVYTLLDAGHIKMLYAVGYLKSNGRRYHVDFMSCNNIGYNISSYHNCGKERD